MIPCGTPSGSAMSVGGTLYRPANPVHGFVLNVLRTRARARNRNRSMVAIVPTLMVNPLGERGGCDWIAKSYLAYEPFDCEHEHRPWMRTEHEHDVFRSHPRLDPRQAGCSIQAERREPSGLKRSRHSKINRCRAPQGAPYHAPHRTWALWGQRSRIDGGAQPRTASPSAHEIAR